MGLHDTELIAPHGMSLHDKKRLAEHGAYPLIFIIIFGNGAQTAQKDISTKIKQPSAMCCKWLFYVVCNGGA